MIDFFRALLLSWLGKAMALLDPNLGAHIAAYDANVKTTEATEATTQQQITAASQTIAANDTQVIAGQSEQATIERQVQANEDDIKTIEMQRRDVAQTVAARDRDIDSEPTGAIDRPLPGPSGAKD